MNPVNDPALRSFVPVAPESPFPIPTLPFGVFARKDGRRRVGVAIGDVVLDLCAAETHGPLQVAALGPGFFRTHGTLNELMRRGPGVWRELRAAVSWLLRQDTPTLRDNAK